MTASGRGKASVVTVNGSSSATRQATTDRANPSVRRSEGGRLAWAAPVVVTVVFVVAAFGWREVQQRRLAARGAGIDRLSTAQSAPTLSPEEALRARITEDLTLRTLTSEPPAERVKQHEAKYLNRRRRELRARQDALPGELQLARVGSALAAALEQERVALEDESRLLERFALYEGDDQRTERLAEYLDSRVATYRAQQRRREAAQEERVRPAVSNRRGALRPLSQLRQADERLAEAWAQSLEAHEGAVEWIRSQTELTDPLFKLCNSELTAVRKAKPVVGRLTVYRGVADRADRVQAWASARQAVLEAEFTRVDVMQMRLEFDTPAYWDYDVVVGYLADELDHPDEACESTSVEAAKEQLTGWLRRRAPLVEARQQLALSLGKAAEGTELGRAYNEWAVALQQEADALSAVRKQLLHDLDAP